MKFSYPHLKRCACGYIPMYYSSSKGRFYIECEKCGKSTEAFDNSSDAINQWNGIGKKKETLFDKLKGLIK